MSLRADNVFEKFTFTDRQKLTVFSLRHSKHPKYRRRNDVSVCIGGRLNESTHSDFAASNGNVKQGKRITRTRNHSFRTAHPTSFIASLIRFVMRRTSQSFNFKSILSVMETNSDLMRDKAASYLISNYSVKHRAKRTSASSLLWGFEFEPLLNITMRLLRILLLVSMNSNREIDKQTFPSRSVSISSQQVLIFV